MDPKTSLHSVEDASLFLPHMLFSDLAHHHLEQFHIMFGLDKLNEFWLEVEKSEDDRLLGHPICLDKRQFQPAAQLVQPLFVACFSKKLLCG